MQNRRAVGIVVLATLSAVNSAAQTPDAWIGTWQVNLEKSTYGTGPKPTAPTTFRVEQTADGIKITFHGTNPQGQPFQNEVVGTFDGKDYPVKGAAFRIRPSLTSVSTGEPSKQLTKWMASRR